MFYPYTSKRKCTRFFILEMNKPTTYIFYSLFVINDLAVDIINCTIKTIQMKISIYVL